MRPVSGFVACLATLGCAATLAAPAKPSGVDFTSQAGMESTCPRLLARDAKRIASDEERTGYAICSALALAKDVAAWLHDGAAMQQIDSPDGRARLRARLESYLARIATTRVVLEGVKASKPMFVVAPGEWAIDFDGDGRVSIQERYFFWVPRRGIDMSPFDRAASEDAYRARYQAPVVNVDQSDVYWALAYCNFAEAALHLVLSYDIADGEMRQVTLVDRERVRIRAYQRLREGIRYSTKLRASLLAETDDDREWIGNPRQANTSFPLVMDEQTFATWGAVLTELQGMLDSKALLGGRVEAGGRTGLGDLTFGLCPSGTGIDLRELLMNPLVRALDAQELSARCTAPTPAKPFSKLAAIASDSFRRYERATSSTSGEWTLLRHLYWVN